ncbi:MAG: flagellar biosynthesis anti-sigma factor FlgM [Capsulimonadaceae bacterium]|nr:flagellar biosynthesis anti-sigma factor FlgM [Capsulimonadaceae bacterium]
MRITGEQSNAASRINSVSGAHAPAAAQSGADESPMSSAATATFSARAQEISRAKAAVNAAPDTRDDLVSSIKDRVDAGTYNPSSDDIAEMMLRRHAADNMGG